MRSPRADNPVGEKAVAWDGAGRQERLHPPRDLRRRGRLRILQALVVGAAGIATAILMAELLLRQFPAWVPEAVRLSSPVFLDQTDRLRKYLAETAHLYVADSDLGIHLRGEVSGFFQAPRPYQSFPYHTVRLPGVDIGVRRRSRVPVRPLGVAVGDSLVFGWGVREEDSWVDLLEERAGFPFVNMGVGGYASLQATRLLERYGHGLRPKVILWGFSHNDFEDNVQFEAWLRSGRVEPYERWRRGSDAPGGAEQRALAALWAWLRNHLAVAELIRSVVWPPAGGTVEYREGGLDFVFFASERRVAPTEMARQGAQFTRHALLRADEIAREMGATLVVVIFPVRGQVYWPLVQRLFPASREDDPDWRTNLVGQFSRENGIRFVDLTPRLREAGARGLQVYFRADRWHLTPLGNRLVADTVLSYLRTEGLPPHKAAR